MKANGAAKGAAPAPKEESSDSSDSSASSDEEDKATASAFASAKAVITKEESSEDDSEESDSDDEPAVPGAVDSKELQGKLEKVASNQVQSCFRALQSPSLFTTLQVSSDDKSDNEEESGSDSDSSASSDSSEESEEEKAAPAPKKRKAEADATPVTKKAKTEITEGEAEATGNLFVGNLSWNVDEDWLVREFEQFGELSGARVMSDKTTGRSRGSVNVLHHRTYLTESSIDLAMSTSSSLRMPLRLLKP